MTVTNNALAEIEDFADECVARDEMELSSRAGIDGQRALEDSYRGAEGAHEMGKEHTQQDPEKEEGKEGSQDRVKGNEKKEMRGGKGGAVVKGREEMGRKKRQRWNIMRARRREKKRTERGEEVEEGKHQESTACGPTMGEEDHSATVPHSVTAMSEEGPPAGTQRAILVRSQEGVRATTETAALGWTEEGCPGTARGDGDGGEEEVASKTEKVMSDAASPRTRNEECSNVDVGGGP